VVRRFQVNHLPLFPSITGCPPHLVAHDVAEVCKLSALQAGEYYNIRLPIEADAQVGNNWAEVH